MPQGKARRALGRPGHLPPAAVAQNGGGATSDWLHGPRHVASLLPATDICAAGLGSSAEDLVTLCWWLIQPRTRRSCLGEGGLNWSVCGRAWRGDGWCSVHTRLWLSPVALALAQLEGLRPRRVPSSLSRACSILDEKAMFSAWVSPLLVAQSPQTAWLSRLPMVAAR